MSAVLDKQERMCRANVVRKCLTYAVNIGYVPEDVPEI